MAGWVLGCHRSGTSLLSSVLRSLTGMHSEDLLGPDLDVHLANPTGFHESTALWRANEQLLSWAGSTWDRPFVARPAWEDPRSLLLISSLRESLANHTGHVGWIDKDPRLCLTRDAYSHLLLRDPAAIAIMRDPLAVTTSLYRRNGFSLRKGAAIWILYNLHLFNSHSRPPETVVLFGDLVSRDEQIQRRVAHDLAAFTSLVSPGEHDDTALRSLERQALVQLAEAQRSDLVRSENRWCGDHRHPGSNGDLEKKLTEMWIGCRDLIRGERHAEMGPYLRDVWASLAPVLEPEVAIPLYERQEANSRPSRLRQRINRIKSHRF